MKIPVPQVSQCVAQAPNWSDLLAKMNNNHQLLCDVLVLFGREAPKLAKAFSQAVANGDTKAACRAAHTLKSNCRQFDLKDWSEFAQALEELAHRAEDVTQLEQYVSAIQEVGRSIADWAEELLESRDNPANR